MNPPPLPMSRTNGLHNGGYEDDEAFAGPSTSTTNGSTTDLFVFKEGPTRRPLVFLVPNYLTNRASVIRLVRKHGGSYEDTRIAKCDVVFIDTETYQNQALAREHYRAANRLGNPLPCVSTSWLYDVDKAKEFLNIRNQVYDPIAGLDALDKKEQKRRKVQERDGKRQEIMIREAARANPALAVLHQKKEMASGAYTAEDRRNIVEHLATTSTSWGGLKVADELVAKYGRRSRYSYQSFIRDNVDRGCCLRKLVQEYLETDRNPVQIPARLRLADGSGGYVGELPESTVSLTRRSSTDNRRERRRSGEGYEDDEDEDTEDPIVTSSNEQAGPSRLNFMGGPPPRRTMLSGFRPHGIRDHLEDALTERQQLHDEIHQTQQRAAAEAAGNAVREESRPHDDMQDEGETDESHTQSQEPPSRSQQQRQIQASNGSASQSRPASAAPAVPWTAAEKKLLTNMTSAIVTRDLQNGVIEESQVQDAARQDSLIELLRRVIQPATWAKLANHRDSKHTAEEWADHFWRNAQIYTSIACAPLRLAVEMPNTQMWQQAQDEDEEEEDLPEQQQQQQQRLSAADEEEEEQEVPSEAAKEAEPTSRPERQLQAADESVNVSASTSRLPPAVESMLQHALKSALESDDDDDDGEEAEEEPLEEQEKEVAEAEDDELAEGSKQAVAEVPEEEMAETVEEAVVKAPGKEVAEGEDEEIAEVEQEEVPQGEEDGSEQLAAQEEVSSEEEAPFEQEQVATTSAAASQRSRHHDSKADMRREQSVAADLADENLLSPTVVVKERRSSQSRRYVDVAVGESQPAHSVPTASTPVRDAATASGSSRKRSRADDVSVSGTAGRSRIASHANIPFYDLSIEEDEQIAPRGQQPSRLLPPDRRARPAPQDQGRRVASTSSTSHRRSSHRAPFSSASPSLDRSTSHGGGGGTSRSMSLIDIELHKQIYRTKLLMLCKDFGLARREQLAPFITPGEEDELRRARARLERHFNGIASEYGVTRDVAVEYVRESGGSFRRAERFLKLFVENLERSRSSRRSVSRGLEFDEEEEEDDMDELIGERITAQEMAAERSDGVYEDTEQPFLKRRRRA